MEELYEMEKLVNPENEILGSLTKVFIKIRNRLKNN